MEKKIMKCWGDNVGANFSEKMIPREEKKRLQDKVDALEIIKGFSKLVWQYCTFTLEDYEKKKAKMKIEREYLELFIPKLFMDEKGKKFDRFYGPYYAWGRDIFETPEQERIVRDYCHNDEREAILENGDVVKYKLVECRPGIKRSEIEWVFSPMLGWDRMPEEVIKQINEFNCMWDYYGNVIIDEFYADPKVGWRNQFFIMKSSEEWKFRIAPHQLIYEGF
jgi:hypothetical protein